MVSLDRDTFEPIESPWRQVKNHQNGFYAEINRFKIFPRLIFHFSPVMIDTHTLEKYAGWVMRIKQKSKYSRPRIALFNADGFGFRIRIKARVYHSINEIFLQILKEYKIEASDYCNLRTVREQVVYDRIIEYKDRFIPTDAFDVAIQKEIEATKSRLGDWRPDKPSMENIIPMEEYLANLSESPKYPLVSSEELERKIAAL